MPTDPEQGYGWYSEHESDLNRLSWIQPERLLVSSREADIWFNAGVQKIDSGTELRGRIVGPRCLFTDAPTAVSPLRSTVRKRNEQPILLARTSFPKPSFWHPDSPNLYRVVLELWQDGQRCDVSGFDLGFRTLEVLPSGVRVNDQPIALRGMARLPDSREEAAEKRYAGYNLILAPPEQVHWWIRANPMGFLLLEEISLARMSLHYYDVDSSQPCFLGLVVGPELLARPPSERDELLRLATTKQVRVGLRLDEMPTVPVPDGLAFLIVPESVMPSLSTNLLPKIILRDQGTRHGDPPVPMPSVLGWIDQ